MLEALIILLNKQPIQQPNWMLVESSHSIIQIEGITSELDPLVVHKPPQLLKRRKSAKRGKHFDEIIFVLFPQLGKND